MLKALIHGTRVCEVAAQEFPVAPPLHWLDCPDDIVADRFTLEDGDFKPVVQAPLVKVSPEEQYNNLPEIVKSFVESMADILGLSIEELRDKIIAQQATKESVQ